jgi:MATE family multidrug resistance protein
VANWVLIYGRMGFPAMGVEGSGWSTTIARFYLFLFLLGALVIEERRRPTGLFRVSRAPEWARFRKMLSLGIPASAQITLELSVFAVATMFAGRFEPSALAAHQIVLNASSLTFMVPLGVASAGAVRVGHALGRDDPPGAGRAGWMAIILGSGFMACAGLAFLLGPGPILAVFTADRDVISVALSLLFVAAVFQLFDGLQVVATGVLRGTGETRTPMVTNLLAHWGLGLPMGYALAFWCGWGLFGLWVGLSVGLIAAGLVLVCLWAKKARDLAGPGSGLAGEAAVREVETA